MSVVRVFTVFHGNLDFSAIPDHDLPRVIERCYWPLLALAEEPGIAIGLEMPARTLQRLAREDPSFVKGLRSLLEQERVELVGSGLAQVIAPLVPADVNRANFELGRDAYAEILGLAPTTWFVHEQTFSNGIAPLYHEVGAQALVMEWNNPASRRPELRPLRFRPARLDCGDAPPLPLLWNDSVVFQKLQRVVHGEVPAREYGTMLVRAIDPDVDSLICGYGGDLEIFDYRPGRPTPLGAESGREMARLAALLRTIARDPRFVMRLPRDARAGLPPGPVVSLASADDPLPCKKQPRYNPTRWAVSGRGGLAMNTRCHRLRRLRRTAVALQRRETRSEQDAARDVVREREQLAELAALWASDYRTRATEEKIERFHARMGAAELHARAALQRLVPALGEGEDVLLVNASDAPWHGEPVEVPLQLAPGRLCCARAEALAGTLDVDSQQIEVHGRHRDGSIRRATLVLAPRLDPGEVLRLRLVGAGARESADPGITALCASTERVAARFVPHRGGALESVAFAAHGGTPVLGTIPHGSFDDVAFAPDFYSALVVAVGEDGAKVADLGPAEAFRVADGPLRRCIGFRMHTPYGEWTKLHRLYRRHDRLDVVHGLRFSETRLRSLRVGTFTCLPEAFDRGSLFYATVNGGRDVERHALAPGVVLDQGAAVSSSVSATSCLGATDGFLAIGDAQRAVGVVVDRARQAVAPLLELRDVAERFFLRIQHTAAESDEMSAGFFRGLWRFAFALVGDTPDLAATRACAAAVERGLVHRTPTSLGVSRAL